MCCYMTSGSLNPAISSEAVRLRLGRSVFRSLAEPHHSSSWKAARPAHMWIYMSGDAEKHPHAQTEIQQGKGKHTNAYIYVFHAYIYFHINQTYLLERFTYECDLFCTSSRTNPQKKISHWKPANEISYYCCTCKAPWCLLSHYILNAVHCISLFSQTGRTKRISGCIQKVQSQQPCQTLVAQKVRGFFVEVWMRKSTLMRIKNP